MELGLSDVSFKGTVGLIETCGERHAEHIAAVMAVARSARACPTGLVAALVYAYPTSQDKILSFAGQVNTGELLEKGDPALHLRKWIAHGRRNPRETILATLAACKAVLQGKKLTRVTAGVTGEDRDGRHSFYWFTWKRRGLKIPGTPGVDVVPSSGG
jgi:hypothetical protein